MLSIGLDVHPKSTALCEYDANGRRAGERVIRGGFHDVAADLAKIKEPFCVCFEASCGYGTLYDLLAALPMAKEVKVAHPAELASIFRSKHKNDRHDARKLAKLLYMGEVPEVHVPREGLDRDRWVAHQEIRNTLGARDAREPSREQRNRSSGSGMNEPEPVVAMAATPDRWLESSRFFPLGP
jgi:hypothetical protein